MRHNGNNKKNIRWGAGDNNNPHHEKEKPRNAESRFHDAERRH